MLDVNNAFGNNSLEFNSQFQAVSSFVSQQTATNASVNFTDLLASAQAESEQGQDGTGSSSVLGQQIPSANSSLSFVPADQFSASGSSFSYAAYIATPVEQNQTPNQSATDKQDWQTDKSSTPRQDSYLGASAAAAGIAAPVAQENPTGATRSADSILTTQQAGTAVTSNADLNLKAFPASQPTSAQGIAAGSAAPSLVVKFDPQGQSAPSQSSTVIAALSAPASGIVRAAADQRPAADQKVLAPPAAVTDQPEPVAPGAAASAKFSDRVKPRKESPATEAKSNAGAGISGAAGEATISTTQTDSVSYPANPATAEVSANTSDTVPKVFSGSKADLNSGLAFALKIQGSGPFTDSGNQSNPATVADTDHSDSPAQTAASAFYSQMTASTGASMGMLEPKSALKSGPTDLASSGVTGQLNINSLAVVPAAVSSSANAGDDTAPADDAAPASALPEDQPANVQSVKTVQVQIGGADDQKVDLKLVEKSGALTMSVRSSDTSLTKSLQQNLPDLTTRLSDQQIRAEWWRPDTQQTDSSKNPGNSSSGGNGSASQEQGNQNKGNSGQQGGRGTPQPDWLDDLSTSNNSNQNGTQFTWHL